MSEKRKIEDYYQVDPRYLAELHMLQIELLKLQKHISDGGQRLMIFFEGRDTAGKGRAIFRFSQFLNPRAYRVVALGKPTPREQGQWYFQRYLSRLPDPGETVFFDRSWYNRAVVEPVMGFCTPAQYEAFMAQVNPLETMLTDDGILLIKLWFSIDMMQQRERIQARLESPLMSWKVSPVDLAAQEKWDDFTAYKERMFAATSTAANPWVIVKGESREHARIQAMRYVLGRLDYPDKDPELRETDPANLTVSEVR